MSKDALSRRAKPQDRLRVPGVQSAVTHVGVDNVELPLLYGGGMKTAERHKRALEVLNLVGLGNRTDHHPNQLSGGSSSASRLPAR